MDSINVIFNFLYDMVTMGLIKNVFLGRCGCNCLNCDILKATLTDDDELRKIKAQNLNNKFNMDIHYKKINCLGCTSDTSTPFCNFLCKNSGLFSR